MSSAKKGSRGKKLVRELMPFCSEALNSDFFPAARLDLRALDLPNRISLSLGVQTLFYLNKPLRERLSQSAVKILLVLKPKNELGCLDTRFPCIAFLGTNTGLLDLDPTT